MADVIAQRLAFIKGEKGAAPAKTAAAAAEEAPVVQHPTNAALSVQHTAAHAQQPATPMAQRAAPVMKFAPRQPPPKRKTGCFWETVFFLDENRRTTALLAALLLLLAPGAALVSTAAEGSFGLTIGVLLLGAFVVLMLYSIASLLLHCLQACCLGDAESHACFQPPKYCRCRFGCCHRRRTFPLQSEKLKREQTFNETT